MSHLDWAVVIVFLAFLLGFAVYTNRFMKGVASFLVANRCAGRYLLCVATGMSSLGALSIISFYEMFHKAGFVPKWWVMMYLPISLVISLTGWVYYRFRQTRAMTLAQFFEMRYSRGFRLFAGILCFVSGIINFGIFPSVGARFFIHFCGLPQQFTLWEFEVSTFVLTMLLLLGVSIIFTFLAGQITIITTDFLQGTFFNITSIILIIFLLGTFSWTQISEGLLISPPDESKINPFLTSGEKSFNIWFFLIGAFVIFSPIQQTVKVDRFVFKKGYDYINGNSHNHCKKRQNLAVNKKIRLYLADYNSEDSKNCSGNQSAVSTKC